MPKNKQKKEPKIDIEKNSSLTAVLLVAVVILSLGFAFSRLLYGRLTFNSLVLAEKNQAKNAIEANVENLEEIKSNYEDLQTTGIEEQDVLSALPAELNYPAVLSQIEMIAITSNVTIQQVDSQENYILQNNESFAPVVPSQIPTSQINFNIRTFGRYNDTIRFINELENSSRPFVIRAFKMSGEDNDVTTTFDITTHYQQGVSIDIIKERLTP